TGSLEGQHFRQSGELVSLSEQNILDCSFGLFGNHGCNGGSMDVCFTYIQDNKGIDTEQSYPYTAKVQDCHFSNDTIGAEDQGYVDIKSGSEDDLMKAVALIGPISVGIDASSSDFMSYKSGIYTSEDCSSDTLDHGVLVVGYGTDEGKDYWLVKNSWGTSWGMDGYIKMARNNKNMCGIATMASYPLV
ncbi:UNVERIFIED_CONTAM: hypothetical protein GTU68_044837, partial [Idotea baltica]|nr:hypothetical protein [Idotea baltica]